MTRVLVLRPEPGATATVERAREMGLEAIAVPLFEIGPVEWQAPDPAQFDAILLTSANAVRTGGDKLSRELPVHAVGKATADAAREAGFAIASAGEGGVDALLAALPPGLRLLHPCGEDRRDPSAPRQAITPVVVYRSKPLTADLHDVAGSVALIHSPRAGEAFAALVGDRSSIAIAAISAAAAAAAGTGWAAVESAQSPDDDALLALAERLCNKSRQQ